MTLPEPKLKLSDNPRVGTFMTPAPATVAADLRVMDAFERMYIDNIRHLPVVNSEQQVVGLLTSSDIAQFTSIEGEAIEDQLVADRMNKSPYTCELTTGVEEVARELETRQLDCALITENQKLVGIFTTTDALVAVRSLIAGELLEPIHPAEHEPTDKAPTTPNEIHLRKRVARDRELNWGLFPTP